MLTISKPTQFNPGGMAVRGQCATDSPGWQLRWFDNQTPPTAVWQGAYKTCRHLQTNCGGCTTIDEVRKRVDSLLSAGTLTQFASMPTDAYQSVREPDAQESTSDTGRRKKKKRKR